MKFENNELIIALTFAVGTPEEKVIGRLRSILESEFRYEVIETKITSFIEKESVGIAKNSGAFLKIWNLMDKGDSIRQSKGSHWLAYKCMENIARIRTPGTNRRAHIITSLKRPEEIRFLRNIYGDSLFVFGLMSEESFRKNQLIERGMSRSEAEKLLERDYDDKKDFGQCFKDTFHLSDFFLKITETSEDSQTIERAINLIFGNPFIFPHWDEYYMHLAFSASLRTADMARQIGSALVDKEGTLISVGSNDVPAFGGGQYPKLHLDERDHARGFDTNTIEVEKIKQEVRSKFLKNFLEQFEVDDAIQTGITEIIYKNFESSLKPLSNITEYFRSVHAEMEAILAATRTGRSPLGGTIYTTTFPCHNCAKHIVGSGIQRVVYIEPYGKSKAASLHPDSISLQFDSIVKDHVCFQPFFGVGPRRFWDLFSLHMSTGHELKRKDDEGMKLNFKTEIANMRLYSPLPAVRAMETTAIEEMKQHKTKAVKRKKIRKMKLTRQRVTQKKAG